MKSHTKSQEILDFLDSQFLSRTKIQNMAKRHGFWRSEQHLKMGPFIALGDDGKQSMVRQQTGRFVKQDKIVIIDSVTKKYVDFFFVKKDEGSALFHTNNFVEKLEKYNSLDSILALNLDGCSGNTGIHTGFLRRLECTLGMCKQSNIAILLKIIKDNHNKWKYFNNKK